MKILVFCSQSLHDIIFSTPVLRALKVQMDQVVVHCALPESLIPVLEENPYKDLLLPSGKVTLTLLKNGKYDALLDLGAPGYIKLYAFLAGIKVVTYPRDSSAQWLMTRLKINKLRNRHVVNRMMESVKDFGLQADDIGLDYFIPERDQVPVDWLPEGFNGGFVLFSITAPYETRKLPLERMIELCDKINKPVLLVGGKEDVETGDTIVRFFQRGESSSMYEEGLNELNKKTTVYNGAGKFNINQVASLVKQSRCVFTFDNETVPMASAFKKQIFLLLGNTIALFGRYPYKTKFIILENNRLDCRPCSIRGYNRCPKRHFKCMRDIVFDFYVA